MKFTEGLDGLIDAVTDENTSDEINGVTPSIYGKTYFLHKAKFMRGQKELKSSFEKIRSRFPCPLPVSPFPDVGIAIPRSEYVERIHPEPRKKNRK